MNDKQAHNKLKKIQESVNSYKNSRRERCNSHKIFSETINEINKTENDIGKTIRSA